MPIQETERDGETRREPLEAVARAAPHRAGAIVRRKHLSEPAVEDEEATWLRHVDALLWIAVAAFGVCMGWILLFR